MSTVAVIGAGSWGTTVARVIAENHTGTMIRLWAYEQSVVKSVNRYHINTDYLPGIVLPKNIVATNNLKDCVQGVSAVILACPSKSVIDICVKIRKFLKPELPFGFVSKGFCKYHQEILTISDAIKKTIPGVKENIVAISGPTHAEEVSQKYHTCINIAGKSRTARNFFVVLLSNVFLECRETEDIKGVELGGTLKNPAAIAAGMISVLNGCGDNLTGALIAESMKEMLKIGRVMGAREETLIDIAGLGDLVATALSGHSRNRRFGVDIAGQLLRTGKSISFYDRILLRFKPESVLARMTEKRHYLAEGAYAIEPLIEIAESNNIMIPVYRSLYEVLLNKKDPKLLIETIKNPSRFEDIYKNTKIRTMDRKRGMEKAGGAVFRRLIIRDVMDKIESNTSYKQQIQEYFNNLLERNNVDTSVSKTGSMYLTDDMELGLIKKAVQDTTGVHIEKLIINYLNEITDNHRYLLSRAILLLLRIRNFFLICKGDLSKVIKRTVSGGFSAKELKALTSRCNTIYIIRNEDLDFTFPVVNELYIQGLPFPRFIVNPHTVHTDFQRKILKLIGGFFIDHIRLENPLYHEVALSYLSYYIGHGIPVLCCIDFSRKYATAEIDFFKMVVDKIKKSTEEIVIVPLSVVKWKNLKRKTSDINHSVEILPPVMVSDYTMHENASDKLKCRLKNVLERLTQDVL